ncbi:Bax inhibitor-1/YccA family protein [Pseudoclavibacter chungangensis]|uniref:Bax inhibitor-1/YccA family protein n=1 Tax=Pseudoclavibacter chungangensis TaxID=587635 RepID=A0A7J5C150_9MICO|nr:Bax inhibitor-1/YccA family protein [Pseudoclavibacter chungangensis]KAB1662349.1 Bax inhibitor-1/YccA family protein [Pseudoclavibacter chungangensis]NYJ65560.1 putative YccA/Bax inhibitor family protein [Pseudoclavibacter chungangensis]
MANSALERNPYFNGQAPSQFNAHQAAPGTQPGYGTPEQLDAQFAKPSASPDQMDRMSVEDTVAKTAGLFVAVLVAAAVAWFVPILMVVGAIGALVLGIVLAFQREPKPGLIWTFAAAEGLLVGGLTSILEQLYPGIAMQAVLATLAVVATVLVLFSFGKVRTSPRMTKIVMVAMVGYLVFSLANFVGMLLTPGSEMFGWRSSVVIPIFGGIPLGVILGIFAVLMGAYMLVMDFEFIQNGVRSGAPRKYGWIGAYSLVSTVVFIYVEILRLIAIFRNN